MDEYKKNLCACCGKSEVGFYEFCKVCGWQNDDIQNDDADFKGGANEMSLNEAREAFRKGEKIY